MPPGARAGAYVSEVLNDSVLAGSPHRVVLAAVAAAGSAPDLADKIGETFGVDAAELGGEIPDVPSGIRIAPLLGPLYQGMLGRSHRRGAGVFYTPVPVIDAVVELAQPASAVGPPDTVCDPSCGGGGFLLAAADRLADHGLDPGEIVAERLWGADVDRLAVDVTRVALLLWSAERSGEPVEAHHVVVADPLDRLGAAWPDFPGGFDLLLGNPPFLGQLKQETARTRRELLRARDVLGEAVGPYTDSATLFLLAALRLARPGGRIAMIVPESVLTARDAAPARAELMTRAELEALWVADEAAFDAGVRVCAPVLAVCGSDTAAPPGGVDVRIGSSSTPAGRVDAVRFRDAPTWGLLLAGIRGVPDVDLDGSRRLGEWCAATAGFRDQYYGIVPFVVEESDLADGHGDGGGSGGGMDEGAWPRLVTSGLVDPATCLWGRRSCRFAKQRWERPRLDLAALEASDPALYSWAVDRLVPKVVVAMQTRVVEVAVDLEGTWFPSTPTVSVVAAEGRLWEVAATLSAPAVSAWAMEQYGGAALSGDAVKLAARQIGDVPLAVDFDALSEAAAHFRTASLAEGGADRLDALRSFAEAMETAYRVSGDVTRWWLDRLPDREPQPSASASH